MAASKSIEVYFTRKLVSSFPTHFTYFMCFLRYLRFLYFLMVLGLSFLFLMLTGTCMKLK